MIEPIAVGSPKTIVADDHVAITMIVTELASQVCDGPVHTADTSDGLMALLDTMGDEPGLLVLDLHMPGKLSGMDLVEEIRRQRPSLSILAYSAEQSPLLVAALLGVGVAGFVPKSAPWSTLKEAMREVSQGGTYVSSCIDLAAIGDHPWHKLTAAEKGVLVRVAKGQGLPEIVERTGRSYSTISSHKYSGLRKLGLESDQHLVAWMYEQGLRFVLLREVHDE